MEVGRKIRSLPTRKRLTTELSDRQHCTPSSSSLVREHPVTSFFPSIHLQKYSIIPLSILNHISTSLGLLFLIRPGGVSSWSGDLYSIKKDKLSTYNQPDRLSGRETYRVVTAGTLFWESISGTAGRPLVTVHWSWAAQAVPGLLRGCGQVSPEFFSLSLSSSSFVFCS